MLFRAVLATALPLLSLTAHALPLARRGAFDPVTEVSNQGLPAAEKGAAGLGAALGSNGDSSSASSSQSSKGSGKASVSSGGSNSTSSSSSGKKSSGKGSGQQAASGTSSAAKPEKTRPCDEGDQSLEVGLNALITVHLGLQAAAKTLHADVSAKKINQATFKTDQQRLQQFIDTANLQLQMTDAIADDGSFAQPQLASLKNSLKAQAATVKSLKGQASDANTLKTLQQSFQKATGVVQDGVANSIVDCNLPLNTLSG